MARVKWSAVVVLAVALRVTFISRQVSPSIVFQVRNYAHIPSFILARSERDILEIYRRAGQRVIWTECDIDEKNLQPCPDLSGVGHVVTLRIQILSRSLSHPATKAMGMAKPDCGIATIFYDRVVTYLPNFTGRTEASMTARVLAYAIAHETGHLLIASPDHSSSGIMRARWQRTDFVTIDNLTLRFTDRDLQLMKHHLAADEIFRP